MTPPIPAVFDCVVFTQALINPYGPAGLCLAAAQKGRVRVFVSNHIIEEIRELPTKQPATLGVTAERVDRLMFDIAKYAELFENVPGSFTYARDPDDAPYVNLADAANARFLITRDRDLLDLMQSDEFGLRFPRLQIIEPPAFLRILETEIVQPE